MAILITGASSGIGEALARQAAKRKQDLVLVARRKEKLDELQEELSTKHEINVEIIPVDLTEKSGIETVVKRIEDGGIDVLINNAGFGSSGPFIELDLDNELNEIDLNVRALVQLSHVAGKAMAENKFGTIVNISSIASYLPMSGNAVYGATKAFVTSFSHALREELSDDGVCVMVVCPGLTISEFHQRSKWDGIDSKSPYPAMLWMSSEDVAEIVFKGMDKQRTVVVPGLVNKVAAALSSSLPGSVTRKVSAFVAKGRRLR